MTVFSPTSRSIRPPLDPDPLGAAIVTALNRNPGHRLSWDWTVVLLLGLLTAGLLPLVILLLRFRTFATSEKFQLEHVTEWLKTRGHDWLELDQATDRLGRSWRCCVASGLAGALIAFIVAVMHVLFFRRSVFELWQIVPFADRGISMTAYVVAVTVAYLVGYGIGMRAYVGNVRAFADAFNFAMRRDGLPDIGVRPRDAMPHWTWITCGIVLALFGCLWGLPMMLAAGVHRRYTNTLSQSMRAEIADRIVSMMRRDPS